MAYGARGKNFNVGLQSPGLLPATKRQLAELKRLDRRDYSHKGLNRDQADELIEANRERREEAHRTLSQMQEGMIDAMWQMAIKAANKAGEQWLETHKEVQFVVFDKETGEKMPIYGPIGTAWLTWPEKGSPLYKWLREKNVPLNKGVLEIPHRYHLTERLEGELQAECCEAAMATFAKTSLAPGMMMMVRSDSLNPRQAA